MDERKASNHSNGLSTVRALLDVVDSVMEPIEAEPIAARRLVLSDQLVNVHIFTFTQFLDRLR